MFKSKKLYSVKLLIIFLLQSVTESFANMIHHLKVGHLTESVIWRSKRMILDTLGVGFLGTNTEVFHIASQYSKVSSKLASRTKSSKCICLLWCIPKGVWVWLIYSIVLYISFAPFFMFYYLSFNIYPHPFLSHYHRTQYYLPVHSYC